MTLQLTESFASNAVTADLARKWWSIGAGVALSTSGGISGGNCIQITNSNAALLNQMWMFQSGKVSITVYMGVWFKISSPPASNQVMFAGCGLGGGWGGGVGILATSGYTYAANAQSPATNNLTGLKPVCDNNWHWLETSSALPALSTSNGTLAWYVDGQYQGSVSGNVNIFGFNVLSGGCWYGTGMWGMSGAGIVTSFSNYIVWDSGATFPSSAAFPMGMQEVLATRPSSDSAVAFTPNTGSTNYTQVNETVPDDDSSYVQGLMGSGLQDLYGYGALPYTPNAINGVMLYSRMRNPGVGQCNYQIIGKSGATQRTITAALTPSQYTSYMGTMQQEFGVDPNTSAAWTPSNLNSATMGIKAV